HHGRVGHVDADLDHGGRDEDVDVAAAEQRHRLFLVGRAHLAVQKPEPPTGPAPARTPRPTGTPRTPAGRLRPRRGHATTLATLRGRPGPTPCGPGCGRAGARRGS